LTVKDTNPPWVILLSAFKRALSGLVRARAMDPNKPFNSTSTTTAFADSEVADLIKLLHLADAAKFLAVSKRTLQQLTADRLVAVVKFGRNVRYDINDLRRFAESRKIREIGWKASSKKATILAN
jgi:excisionase family DNA binding protein